MIVIKERINFKPLFFCFVYLNKKIVSYHFKSQRRGSDIIRGAMFKRWAASKIPHCLEQVLILNK